LLRNDDYNDGNICKDNNNNNKDKEDLIGFANDGSLALAHLRVPLGSPKNTVAAAAVAGAVAKAAANVSS
jgi:hypothetical protein